MAGETEFKKEVLISLSVDEMADSLANVSDDQQSHFFNRFADTLRNYCTTPINYEVQVLCISKLLDAKGIDLIRKLEEATRDQ